MLPPSQKTHALVANSEKVNRSKTNRPAVNENMNRIERNMSTGSVLSYGSKSIVPLPPPESHDHPIIVNEAKKRNEVIFKKLTEQVLAMDVGSI